MKKRHQRRPWFHLVAESGSVCVCSPQRAQGAGEMFGDGVGHRTDAAEDGSERILVDLGETTDGQ